MHSSMATPAHLRSGHDPNSLRFLHIPHREPAAAQRNEMTTVKNQIQLDRGGISRAESRVFLLPGRRESNSRKREALGSSL